MVRILIVLVFVKKINNMLSIKFIWAIEEYAINLFESDWKQQEIAEIKLPNKLIKNKSLKFCGNIERIRIIPYPPNFKRIAARIIEPAVGDSTCAFGSHKWRRKKGSLTKKGNTNKNKYKEKVCSKKCNEVLLVCAKKNNNILIKGREQKKAYNIK